MFNSGIRGKRASDNTGTIASQTQFIQQKYPQPSITGYSILGIDDTALNPAGGQTVLVNGTGFASGAAVTVNGQTISPVTVISPTQLSFTSIALAGGSYSLIVYNSTGGAAILVPGLIYSAVPTWTTAAGSIGTTYETTPINTSVVATSDSAITYSLSSGSLPSGATLYANGVITGTSPVESGSTTYTFAIKAEDAELQDTTRTFTLTINTDVVTWVSPADGTTYTANINEVAGNVVLSATSAAGYNVSYAANTLPTGLTLTGNTISGTPTVVGNSATLLTATAATTNRNSTRTINWVIQLGSDPYFYATSLLLNGETSSSYWVQDVSTNGFNITVNGNTRPVSTSPYNTAYSVLFNGSSNYLSVDANSAFSFGTGDFTVECFVKTGDNSLAPGGYSRSIMRVCQIDFYLRITQYHGGTDGALIVEGLSSGSTVTLKDNVWHHVALVRESSTVRLWIDGVYQTLGSGGTNTTNYSNSELNIFGGRSNPTGGYFNGYISNLRIVKGTAVYTGTNNFRVPTSPLTAIANTSILICNSNRLIDSSGNNLTVTAVSSPTVSNFTPLTETDLITGSGYFDGNGDYLTSPTSFNTGNNWTVEAWCYFTGAANNDPLFVSNPEYLYLVWLGSTFYLGDSSINNIVVTNKPINRWFHVAAVKNGANYVVYIDGVSAGTSSSALASQTVTSWWIGARTSQNQYATGYISNFRAVNGTAVYTGNFTPPTSPLTAIANTSLLTLQSRIGENNNRFIDTSGVNNIITRNGNATQGTFGPYSQTGWSYYFDGTSDYLGFSGGSINFPSSTEFTVECWVYKTARDASGYSVVIDGAQNNQFAYDNTTEGSVSLVIAGTGVIGVSGTAVQTNAWSHIAWVRQGTNTCRIYVNGVQQGTGTSTAGFDISIVGSYLGGGYEINGYLSNLRIVVGTCLYNNGTTFTPPTTPLTSVANTKLLTCQSNRFVDNGPLNYTISVAGNTSVQSFSPFAPAITTPTSYSGYFDGNGDNISFNNSTNFAFGTGAFTIEFWIYAATASNSFLLGGRNAIGGMHITLGGYGGTTSGSLRYVASSTITSGTTLIADNSWHHCAIVRDGSTNITLYVDGISRGTGTDTNNYTATSGSFVIGQNDLGASEYLTGYLSNYRIVKGTAVYTSSFTPPTAPLSAISNTSLLILQSNTFIDNSANSLSLTINGDTVVRNFNPFGITTTTGSNSAYSIANVGGSMYFDGTGDYLGYSSNAVFTFGTDNFTVEAWVYITAAADFSIFNVGSNQIGSYGLYWIGSTSKFESVRYGDAAGSGRTTNTYGINRWLHVAAVRSGGTAKLYINGVADTGATYAMGSVTASNGESGRIWELSAVNNGYISNLRILKGTALYTSNFAPPAAPLTSIAGTTLLVNGTNSGIIDYTSKNILETVGNTQLSAAVKKFGSASMYFNGSGNYVVISALNPVLNFGSGNFTIESWYYQTGGSGFRAFACNRNTPDEIGSTATSAIFFGLNGSNNLYYDSYATVLNGSGTVSNNVWVHIACVRNGTTVTLYLNGVSQGTTTDGNVKSTRAMYVGGFSTTYPLTGYLDDFRITVGIARYTTNFTPPTSGFNTF